MELFLSWHFKKLGYPKEAFINYIAFLGWSPGNEKEFLSVNEIIQQFDISRFNKSPAVFDVFHSNIADDFQGDAGFEKSLKATSKLNHLSNLHIRGKSKEEYLQEIYPYIESGILEKIEKEKLNLLLVYLRNYLNYYKEVNAYLIDFFAPFSSKKITDSAKEWLDKKEAMPIILSFQKEMSTINSWDISQSTEQEITASIKSAIKQAGKNANTQGKPLFMTLRSAITGKTEGMELPVVIFILGKKEIENRISYFLN